MPITAAVNRYRSQFNSIPLTPSPWFNALRTNGLNRFSELGFPSNNRGNEAWKYTNVSPVVDAELRQSADSTISDPRLFKAIPSSREWTRLVFVNGHPVNINSTKLAMSLDDAIEKDGRWLAEYLGQGNAVNSDGFVALNTAFLRDGAVLRIPRDTKPGLIHVVFVALGDSTISHPRMLIVAEPGSSASVIETHLNIESNHIVTNAVTEIVVEESAHLSHTKLVLGAPGAFHIGSTESLVGKNARLVSGVYVDAADLTRNALRISLDGENASSVLRALSVTQGSQHVDNQTSIEHLASGTSSIQAYRSVLDGTSRNVFSGRVYVDPAAAKAQAEQSTRSLVLSEKAEADSKPSLEIWNDDVKCNHGATIGRLDDSALFYLRTRGIGEVAARQILVDAFAAEMIDATEPKAIRNFLTRRIQLIRSGAPEVSERTQ